GQVNECRGRSTSAIRASIPPRSKASGDEKGPKRSRQQIEKDERRQKRSLLGQILAERVLAGQCSGRNLQNDENQYCRRDRHDSSHLQPVTENVTNRRAETATDQNRNEK